MPTSVPARGVNGSPHPAPRPAYTYHSTVRPSIKLGAEPASSNLNNPRRVRRQRSKVLVPNGVSIDRELPPVPHLSPPKHRVSSMNRYSSPGQDITIMYLPPSWQNKPVAVIENDSEDDPCPSPGIGRPSSSRPVTSQRLPLQQSTGFWDDYNKGERQPRQTRPVSNSNSSSSSKMKNRKSQQLARKTRGRSPLLENSSTHSFGLVKPSEKRRGSADPESLTLSHVLSTTPPMKSFTLLQAGKKWSRRLLPTRWSSKRFKNRLFPKRWLKRWRDQASINSEKRDRENGSAGRRVSVAAEGAAIRRVLSRPTLDDLLSSPLHVWGRHTGSSEDVINLNAVEGPRSSTSGRPNPLHDASADRYFSDSFAETMKWYKSHQDSNGNLVLLDEQAPESDKKPVLAPAIEMRPRNQHVNSLSLENYAADIDNAMQGLSSQPSIGSGKGPAPVVAVTNLDAQDVLSFPPQPGPRTSSRTNATLASASRLSYPAAMANRFQDTASTSSLPLDSFSKPLPIPTASATRKMEAPTRRPPANSQVQPEAAFESSSIPRPNPWSSTDTLTRIETQADVNQPYSPSPLSTLHLQSSLQHLRSGAPMTRPPERPLPELPDDPDRTNSGSRSSTRSLRRLRQPRGLLVDATNSLASTLCEQSPSVQSQPPSTPPHQIRAVATPEPVSSPSALHNKPSIQSATHTSNVLIQSNPLLGHHSRASSTGSPSPQARMGANKSAYRASRVHLLKKRDIERASSHRRIIEEECEDETQISAGPALSPVLEQFPTVPTSRPASQAESSTRSSIDRSLRRGDFNKSVNGIQRVWSPAGSENAALSRASASQLPAIQGGQNIAPLSISQKRSQHSADSQIPRSAMGAAAATTTLVAAPTPPSSPESSIASFGEEARARTGPPAGGHRQQESNSSRSRKSSTGGSGTEALSLNAEIGRLGDYMAMQDVKIERLHKMLSLALRFDFRSSNGSSKMSMMSREEREALVTSGSSFMDEPLLSPVHSNSNSNSNSNSSSSRKGAHSYGSGGGVCNANNNWRGGLDFRTRPSSTSTDETAKTCFTASASASDVSYGGGGGYYAAKVAEYPAQVVEAEEKEGNDGGYGGVGGRHSSSSNRVSCTFDHVDVDSMIDQLWGPRGIADGIGNASSGIAIGSAAGDGGNGDCDDDSVGAASGGPWSPVVVRRQSSTNGSMRVLRLQRSAMC